MDDDVPAVDRIPPLQSLRAFEASVRLRSLTRAAEELGVTPSAVTQHVRTVEAWVGSPLFRRTGREIVPTDVAEAAMYSLREGFDRIAEGAQLLRAPDRKGRVISISTPPSFASKWLLPRLDRFRAQHPTLEVWVAADVKLVDFNQGDVDLAIRYGPGGYEGLVTEQILTEAVVPVASPALLEQLGPMAKAADLLRAPLLHDVGAEADPTCPSWRQWFRTRGVDDMRSLEGPRYNDSGLVIDEAIADGDIRKGKLVVLLGDATPLQSVYWLAWPRGRTLMPPVRAFIAWMKAETLGDVADGAGI